MGPGARYAGRCERNWAIPGSEPIKVAYDCDKALAFFKQILPDNGWQQPIIRNILRDLFTEAVMAEGPDYIGLSKRFESFAERATDPLLAESYRKLAQTYRALDYWHERFKQRYEQAIDPAADTTGGAASGRERK